MDLTPCPECHRKYPTNSEAGVWITMHGRCFPCLLDPVLKEVQQRNRAAGHAVEDCAVCFPYHNDPACSGCAGVGYREVPLPALVEGETITPIPQS